MSTWFCTLVAILAVGFWLKSNSDQIETERSLDIVARQIADWYGDMATRHYHLYNNHNENPICDQFFDPDPGLALSRFDACERLRKARHVSSGCGSAA